jgi:hypothetical protein
MVTSGNYRMVLTYFPPGEPLEMEQVELVFGYTGTAPTVPQSQAAPITTSRQPAVIQNPTLFQNIDDGFRVQVPEGWVIQDVNNTGSTLIEESTQGYGILAQLCPEEEQAPPNVGGGSLYGSCEGVQQNIIYILRYPSLDTELQSAFGVSTNSITTDNVLLYHVQKLQQVGYSGIQIVNSTETSVNVIDAQRNQTTSIVPAKTVEMTYSTASAAPNQIREGYFILTATNATNPNPGMTKGYSIFYEGNSVAAEAQGQTTTTTAGAPVSLAPRSPAPPAEVMQAFDSFELIAAPEVITQASEQQAAIAAELGEQQGGTACDPSYPDVCIPPPPPNLNCDDEGVPENFEVSGSDPHGFDGDNDGIGCESGSDAPDDDDDNGGDDDDNGGGEGGEEETPPPIEEPPIEEPPGEEEEGSGEEGEETPSSGEGEEGGAPGGAA